MRRTLTRAFAAAAIGWAGALPLATWIASRPHPLAAPYALAFAVYGVGAWICHQRPDRSFHLWTMQMPVCARCTGIYAGAAIAVFCAYVARRFRLRIRLPQTAVASAAAVSRAIHARRVLVIASLPTVVTLGFEWATGVTPSNAIRAAAGLPLGAAVAWLVLQAEVN